MFGLDLGQKVEGLDERLVKEIDKRFRHWEKNKGKDSKYYYFMRLIEFDFDHISQSKVDV